MAKILGYKRKLSYYLKLIDMREKDGDLWGVLDACRNAKNMTKSKCKKASFDVLIANTYYKMEEHLLACGSFFKAISVDELRCSCLFGIGRSLACLNLFDLSLEYFETAIKWDSDNKFSQSILQWTEYIMSKIDDPKTLIDEIIKNAKIALLKKEYETAINCLKPLLSKSEKAQNYYALALFLQGNLIESACQNQINLKSDGNIFALCLQYDIYKKNGNIVGQQQIATQILNAKTENIDYLTNKALFLVKHGFYRESVDTFKLCLNLAPYSPKLHLFLAQASYNAGNIDDALYYVSRARWIDFDNPIYMFYYDLFKKQSLPKPIKVFDGFDKQCASQKIQELSDNLDDANFVFFLFKNHFLLEDLSYGIANDDDVCNKASQILANTQNKNGKIFFNEMLLSIKPNSYKKFLMLRCALFSEKFNKIKLVYNLKFLEIKTQKNDLTIFNSKIKAGICNAHAYAFCSFLNQKDIDKVLKNAKQILNKKIFLSLDENELACLMLGDNLVVFSCACKFFKVDIEKVKLYKSLLNFSNLENYETQN